MLGLMMSSLSNPKFLFLYFFPPFHTNGSADGTRSNRMNIFVSDAYPIVTSSKQVDG
jgi:hypothetical protein